MNTAMKYRKLTKVVIARRVRMYERGMSIMKIAEREGVTHQAIYECLRRSGVEFREVPLLDPRNSPRCQPTVRKCVVCGAKYKFKPHKLKAYRSPKYCSRKCSPWGKYLRRRAK